MIKAVRTEVIGNVVQAVFPCPGTPHGLYWVNISIEQVNGQSVAAEFAARVAETNRTIHGLK